MVAGILLLRENQSPKIVAIGAGVKCLPLKCYEGSLRYQLVRDMHAEVLTRRAFIAYLCTQIMEADAGRDSILFKTKEEEYELQDGISFGMYINQAPCGDASMHILEPRKIVLEQSDVQGEPPMKRPKMMRGREGVHLRGILRTKPGRRDAPPAPSLSCTDKIALWSSLGWQGAILGKYLTRPIFIKEFQIGERFDADSIGIGILEKIVNDIKPSFSHYTGRPFKYGLETVVADGKDPTSVGQVWFEGGVAETIADGRKLGASKPKNGQLSRNCQSCISTERIAMTMSKVPLTAKQSNIEYQRKKAVLFRDGPFNGWPESNPEMSSFRSSL